MPNWNNGGGEVTFTGSASGTISIKLFPIQNRACYIKSITVTYEDNTPPSTNPWIDVTPDPLNIDDDGGVFTVSAANMPDNGLGVSVDSSSPSNAFSFSKTDDNTFNDQHNYFPLTGNANNKYDLESGTVQVNYTGHALSAAGVIKFESTPESTTADVKYLYDGDIYIVGDVEGSGWSTEGGTVHGVPLVKNADGTYSVTVTATAGGEGFSWLYFTKSIDAPNYYALGDNRFGPVSNDSNWPFTDNLNGVYCDLDTEGNLHTIKMSPGQYTITINPATNQFKITKVTGPVTYVKVTSTDDLTDGNYLIVYETGNVALDGSLQTLDAIGNTQHVDIDNGTIETAAPIYFTYDANAKTLKSASGFFIGHTGNKNTLDQSATADAGFTNNITFDSNGNALINVDATYQLRFNKTSGQERFRYFSGTNQQLIQLYKEYNPNKVATPTFSPAAGTYTSAQTVTISCATDGATILYSTDGGNTWKEGNTVTVGETMTIQAKATKAGKEDSNVATATYTINLPASVSSIAEVNVLDPGKDFVFNNKAVVVYHKGNQMWIQDYDIDENTVGGALVYDENGFSFDKKDVLKTGWTGTTNVYSGNKQIINLDAEKDNTDTKEPVALKRTSLAPVNEQEYVLLEGVTISDDLKIMLGEQEVLLYPAKFQLFTDFEPKEGFTYNVKGIFDIYNDTYEIYPLSIELNKKDVDLAFGDTPDIYVGNEVTLTVTGAPEGATVTFECTPEGAVTFEGNKATFNTEGEVTITAKTAATDEYNAGEVSKTFNVQAKTTPTLTFEPNKVELYVGDTFNAPSLTTNPEGLEVEYTVKNGDSEVVIAEIVNGELVVHTNKAGTATVTATYAGSNQYNNTSASYPITISKKDVNLAFGDTPDIYVGNEVTLTVTGAPEGTTVNFVCAPEGAVTFGENGKATFNTQGEVIITATTAATDEYNAGEVSKTFNVQAKTTPTLSFGNQTAFTLTIGDDFTAPTLTGVPEGGEVIYESSNSNVATVDADGTVHIVGIGEAEITATYAGNNQYNGATAHYTITVKDVEEALAAPTFSPAAGTYTEPKEVAIACATPGVTIEYSINGGETQTYTKPFLVSENCTVTATAKMGTRTVYTPATSSATYTINAADAANIADDYYFLQSNAAEVSGKYANVAGRRTLNFVADADKQAGTVFRVMTDPDTIGQVETLRSQAVDLQGYANRAMAYVPKVIDLVLSTLANSSLGDPETPGTGILGENGLDLILNKFYEGFDYNLYVEEGTEGTYRIYGRTPSMQHVVDFYHENTAQVEEKLLMLEDYINQVLDKIRSKVGQAGMNEGAIPEFSLKTVRDRIAEKNGIALIDPVDNDSKMEFYRQVLNNKEYVWDFAYQTAMIYVDAIKQTGTYQNLPNEYKLYVEKMEKVRPDTKYYIIERGNELDYISENNGEIISNDPRTLWTLTKRENFTVNVPEANKLNDSYYTTLYTDFGYELPTGVNAYAVTGIDENDVAQLTEITGAIPAQTPVLLKANAAGTVNVTLTTAAGNTPETNLLEGPDYLVKTYGITSPTVEMLFNMAAGFVPAETLADYEYLKLRTSGTVNNKYMWNVNDALDKCTYKDANNENDCVVRSLVVKDGTLAFSEHWTTETNKAFLVSDTKPVIYLEKETLAAPTFSPVPGSYTVDNGQNVTITITTEDDATIKYSTDGGKTWNTYEGPIAASDDMTIVAKAEKDGMIASDEVTAVYVIDNPTVLPDVPAMKGYYQIKNNGNSKYANVAGRKTLNFVEDPADKAGTVIWLETNDKGQVQSLRSQAADLQRYADRAMSYVPEIVELVADKLNADGSGNILGEHGLDAIMAKFNESFDHHLYVEPAEGGYRIFGRTPSMQPVVDFYRENKDRVEAKLPDLETFINNALKKLRDRIGGSSVFTNFSLHQIWENMGGTLTEPTDDASTMAFYREVLNNKNYVWDFAYQTAMIYVNNLKQNQHWSEVETALGEYAQYIDMIEQVHPEFKYYIVQKDGKPDFISQGNTDIINNAARTIWTLEERTTFNVNIDENNLFGCPLAGGVGGYATTLYTDFAYELPDNVDDVDVTAYKVTSIEGGKATIEALSGIIPAQTPVLLTAKVAGTVTLKLTTEPATADTTGNLLRGPDYLINVYDLKTDQVQSLFDQIKQKLGQDFYDTYVAQYEYLADLNSGTVNNKYFWGLKESDVEKCSNDGGENCVVRNLSGDKFIDNWKVETNKAFLVTDEYAEITFNTLHGDVNHDGLVNIEDVTDLIDRLLGMPDAYHLKACEYCSDVNKNGTVKIDDVTTLIDILLGIDGSNQATDPQGGE